MLCSCLSHLISSQHWVRACAPEKNVFSIPSFIQSLLCLPLLLKMSKGGNIILHWHLLHSSSFVRMISPYLHTHGVNTLNPALQVGIWGFREFKFTLAWVVDSCLSNSKIHNSLFYTTLSSNCILLFKFNQSTVFPKFGIPTSEYRRKCGSHSLLLCKNSGARVLMLGTAHSTPGWQRSLPKNLYSPAQWASVENSIKFWR